MKKDHKKHVAITLLVVGVLFLSACHKRVASAPAVSMPPQQAPSAAVQPATPPPARPAASPAQAPAPATPSLDELFQQNVKDAFFDFNKADIRTETREDLSQDSDFLRKYANVRIEVEGHCDDRGGEEYNLALGDLRATAVKHYLVSQGIPQDRIQTVSMGKEHPFCEQDNEACWQQNRRGHFVMSW